MVESLNLVSWIQEQQGIAVGLAMMIIGAILLWKDIIVTGRRHHEIVKDRDWWRDYAEKLRNETNEDKYWRNQIADALWQMANILEDRVSSEKTRRWFEKLRI